MLVLLPLLAGPLTWWASGRVAEDRRRVFLASVGGTTLVVTTAVGVAVAVQRPSSVAELGEGWRLVHDVTPLAGIVAVLVPVVALLVVVYAAAHEQARGLGRLIGGLVAFVGAMELIVVAGDLLTLLIGWELVGAVSWGLIAQDWRDPTVPRQAAHAFNATRLGDLGLFVAAGAALAGVGTLDYDGLGTLSGGELHVVVAGVILAATAKSAQGPFAPWLFSAMAGPSSVSALLHSATMVAAGAYLLARLHPVLDRADWFGPTTIGIGLATALAGGAVAALQTHTKKLLAASTSAQYGLMFVAVGGGFPAAATAHLVTHAVFKSLLFLVAGIAIVVTGSATLGRHRLGSHLPIVAGASLVGALALAAVPPLGAAWTKEEVVAAGGHHAPWLAVAVAIAGGLSALYAARFHLLSYGPTQGGLRDLGRPSRSERGAVVALAAASIGLGVLLIPGSAEAVSDLFDAPLPPGEPWELALSLLLVAAGMWTAAVADRRDRLGSLGMTGATSQAADWLGLPTLTRRAVDGALRLAAAAARFDDRIVDAGVRVAAAVGVGLSWLLAGPGAWNLPRKGVRRGVEPSVDRVVHGAAAAVRWLADRASVLIELVVDGVVEGTATGVGVAGRDLRRLQTGQVHHYYVLIVVGLGLLVAVAAIWR